jgi:hypothetical protein
MSTKIIVDCSTGETTELELTVEELAQAAEAEAEFADRKAAEESEAAARSALKSSARAKLISGTPLTEEEAAVLVI